MCIEVYNCDVAVDFVQGSERGQGDGVVASKSEQLWDMPVTDGRVSASFRRCAVSQIRESFSHLSQSQCVVEGRDWDVSTVDHFGP